jgi:hypothetical protein
VLVSEGTGSFVNLSREIPKLDVAGSIPVARSNGHRGSRRMP